MKRITTILMLLMLVCMGAGATEITLTSASQIKGGTFYDGSGNIGTSSSWYNKVITNSFIPITLDFGNQTGVSNHSGKLNVYGSKTLTITSPFKITGYTLTGTPTAACTVTPAGESATNWAASTSGTVTVSGLDTYTTTIAFTGEADGNTECLIDVTSFVITVANLTDVSQISTSKYYMLYNQGRGSYMNVNPTTGQVQISSTLPQTRNGILPFIIRFESNTAAKSEGDAYQLKFYDGTYLPWAGNTAVYVSTSKGFNGSNNEGYLPTWNSTYFNFQVYKGGSSRTHFFNGNALSNGVGGFTFWDNGTGGNSQWQIYEVDGTDLQDIDYNLSFNETTTSNNSRKLLTYKSSTIAVPTATGRDANLFTYASSKYVTPAAVTASANGSAITLSCTANYPFATTALVDGKIPADAPIYRMKGNVGNTPTYLTNSDGSVVYYTSGTLTENDYFCFTGDPVNGFRIYNVGAGANVNLGSDSPAQGTAPALTSSDHVWRLYANGNTNFGFQQKKTGSTNLSNAYLCNVSSAFTYWISSYAESDNGSMMAVEEATFDDVTYNVLLEASGTAKATTKVSPTNRVLAVPSSDTRDFCTYTYYTDAACTEEITALPMGTTTVYAKTNWTGPFDISPNYASATWYYMNLKSGETHVPTYDSESTPNVSMSTSPRVFENANQEWCFVGNPYDGFQIYNKAANADVTLGTSANPSSDGNTGGNTKVALSDSPTYGTWFVQESAYGTNGFYLFLKVGDNKYAANLRSGNFAFWTGGYDNGSTFTVEEVTANYKDYVDANISPWFDTMGEYFSLAYDIPYANNTYAPALESCDLSTYNALLAYVSDASHYRYPASGYYRLRNYRYDTSYMGLESNLAQFADGGSKAATVVYLTKHESNNTYTIQLQGKYVQTPTSGAQVTMGDDAVWFTPTVDAPGIFSLNAGGGNRGNLHNDGYQKIVGWEATGRANNNASYWYIEKASSFNVSLNSDGAGTYYATGYWPFDVTISGADAYTLKLDGTGNWLVPTLLTDNKVPANTPVMLKGSSNTATATIRTAGDAFTTSNVNSLSGTNTAKDFALTGGATTEYFMGISDGVVGFYHSGVASKTGYYTLKANRAYLQEQYGQARGYAVMWDDSETTGISSLDGEQSAKGNSTVYDLQGRKVANPSRGLYIVNGKKVIIK